jgi:hypothetical protein
VALVVDEQTGTERVADHEALDDETLRLPPHDRRGVRGLRRVAQQHRAAAC